MTKGLRLAENHTKRARERISTTPNRCGPARECLNYSVMRPVLPEFRVLFVLVLLAVGLVPRAGAQSIHTCTIIPTPAGATATTTAPSYLPPGARAAVSYRPGRSQDTKWTTGSTITVRFLGGTAALRQRVMRYAGEWTEHANLNFRVVSGGAADIRISFTQNGGSWSVIGRSANRLPQDRPTMNFGWLNDRTPDYEVKRTVLHEFGHALGLLHEHQNPAGGIPWDEDAVYNHYYRTQGWSRKMTYDNVMATASTDATQFSAYDAASIMHYPVDERLTGGAYAVGMNNELSPTDKAYIAHLYPGRRATVATVPDRSPTATTTSRPTRPTTTTPTRPTAASRRYVVRINNELGRNVKRELVQLDINGRRYQIRLNRNGRTRQRIDLNLPPGRYDYSVVSASVYDTYRDVRTPQGIRRQRGERKVSGSGSGVVTVSGNTSLTLFGRYDKSRRRMRVYLGERGK